ncbi:hypothetical protein CDAR_250291 [Caerostris darwini]|uniref:Uncharacterized protein n=1 Tax=Caerostris darwini TaxID=1538125 RepID=A0AAV4QJ04_9ARAC|nr:hypothetical protein CDAR_250291 [Caerostris darwini]
MKNALGVKTRIGDCQRFIDPEFNCFQYLQLKKLSTHSSPENRNANRIDEAALHRLKGIFIGPAIKEPSGRLSHRFPGNTKPETITIHGGGWVKSVPENTCVFPKKLISRESD